VRVVEMVGELVEGYGEAEETLMAKIANKNNQILSLRAQNDRLLNALSIQQQVTENSSNHVLNLQIAPPQTLEGESDSNSEEGDLSETWTTIKTMSPNDIYSPQDTMREVEENESKIEWPFNQDRKSHRNQIDNFN